MPRLSRRHFLARSITTVPTSLILTASSAAIPDTSRLGRAAELRERATKRQSARKLVVPNPNGDETTLPSRIGCYTKGLPHNALGEVDAGAYQTLLAAIQSDNFSDFEHISRSGGRTLSNPQACATFHLEGGDPHTFPIPPAPSISKSECAADNDQLYWQSICRDISFSEYQTSPVIARAVKHLGSETQKVFRGGGKGANKGPYISQFLLRPIPYGAGHIEQRYNVPTAGSDFMTAFGEWVQLQTGFQPWREVIYDPTPRYIRNGRDLAEFVHYDFAYQAHLSAALILINANAKSIHNCNQFKSASNPYRYSTVEDGFVTFGPAEAADWIGRVTTAALKAAYFQKWAIHRRLRPETLGGLIHKTRTSMKAYPIHDSLLHSDAVEAVYEKHRSYLLPQAYPEGCPLHPSYPSGHAAIAGACAVVLKACFDGSMLLPACVEPSADGLHLKPCADYFPTVNSEINKLAFNIAGGREWAGIHYQSDSTAGLELGEAVAISILQDLATTYTESFRGFSFSKFDDTRITITPDGNVLSNA